MSQIPWTTEIVFDGFLTVPDNCRVDYYEISLKSGLNSSSSGHQVTKRQIRTSGHPGEGGSVYLPDRWQGAYIANEEQITIITILPFESVYLPHRDITTAAIF
ncbi:unnamed protein product [Allacma fusca]|uniref:Uncharacterized protein n=1 Tax=Allacma fusca TaxID=39272 RepID=A0A8J2Q599_9HEXA|nr:unnamed protein product [Allacma fusca]